MVGLGARQETFVVTAASYGLLGIAFLLGFRRECAGRPDAGLTLGPCSGWWGGIGPSCCSSSPTC